jgi:transcription initiation factor TFIIIB Brf1 subunit/transcription initiation factor TFIIB
VPNYQNMIYAYEDLKGQDESTITKADIKAMEEKILVQLGFDFSFSSPRHFLDRYMRLLDDQCTEETKTLALQILVLQQVNEKMLAYSGSQVAASSLILAINQQNMHDLIKHIEDGTTSES